MSGPLKYHEGELAVQKRAGAFDPADLEGNGLGSALDSRAAAFLGLQPWAVIAALDRDSQVWTSPVHGPPGFLRVADERTLAIHASLPSGDPLAGRFRRESELGMLVLDPRTRRRMRINGRAQQTAGGPLVLRTREVFANCPKYIQRRELAGAVSSGRTGVLSMFALTAGQRERIARADTFFIGSMHAAAGIDCSHRGGNPGFVRVLGERRLAVPDYSGNNMFQTLGNLSLDPRAGLLFIDFETGRTLQLTGTATILWDTASLREWPGAQRLVELEISQVVENESPFPLRWRMIEPSPFNPA